MLYIGAFAQRAVNYNDISSSSTQSYLGQVSMPTGNSWEAKHFREALTRGREYRSYYVLINDDKKVVKVESLIEFCRAHDYSWNEKYESKEISKFGDVATSVYKFYFIPKAEFQNYVFEWTDRTASRSGDLKSCGSVYFYDPAINSFLCLREKALWSGSILDGFVEGTGAGIWEKDNHTYYYFSGTFQKGFPVGKAKYRIVDTNVQCAWGYSPREKLPSGKNADGPPFREVEVGNMSEGMATFRYLDDGEKKGNGSELYGYVNQTGTIAVKPTYKSASSFKNGRAAVDNDKGENVYIDKTGQFVDYTEKQKKIFADAKAEQDRIAAEQERQRLLAEQKAAEEKRIAKEKEAALQRRIEANKNTKLWSRGCRLCYRYPNGYEYVLATLEEWNESHTKVKVKIVASPSSTRTLNGDLLEKNNTMWVSARNEGWHLALDEEITAALNNDNSVRQSSSSSSSSSYSQSYSDCSTCRGTGYVKCYSCNGTGAYDDSSWDEDENYRTCSSCHGRGKVTCSSCNGTGRR